MPRAETTKFYRTFSKGLITEAGYLTYPEDASFDELNTILSRKGNRSRRLGADYETGFVLNAFNASDHPATNEFVWSSVNSDPLVTFVCVQTGTKIRFFRKVEGSVSAQLQPFEIDLYNYKIPTATFDALEREYVDFSAGSGLLFLANRFADPVSVEYVPETNTLIVIPIVIQVRDFEGVYDALANDQEPTSLSAQHHYNLLNQGWVNPGTPLVDISVPDYSSPPSDTVPPTPSGDTAPNGNPAYLNPFTGETTFRSGNPIP